MKKILIIPAAILMLLSTLAGCKKDGALKPVTADSTVTTLATGAFSFVTTDNTGELYALGYGGSTIFKYDGHNGKIAFYTSPQVSSGDTTAVNKLECLTSDSLGNVYTVSVNDAGVADILKITSSGAASTILSNVNSNNTYPIQCLATYNGTFYFSNPDGIYKIVAGCAPQFLVSIINSSFAIDRNGNVIYTAYSQANNNGQISLDEITPQGAQSVVVANLYTAINSGITATVATDKLGNVCTYVTADSFALLKTNSNAKTTTLLSGVIGNVDGTFKTAKIAGVIDMVADPSGNIYFSQGSGLSANSVRKITF